MIFQISSIDEGCLSPPEILCVLVMVMCLVHGWVGEMPIRERGRGSPVRSDQGDRRDL